MAKSIWFKGAPTRTQFASPPTARGEDGAASVRGCRPGRTGHRVIRGYARGSIARSLKLRRHQERRWPSAGQPKHPSTTPARHSTPCRCCAPTGDRQRAGISLEADLTPEPPDDTFTPEPQTPGRLPPPQAAQGARHRGRAGRQLRFRHRGQKSRSGRPTRPALRVRQMPLYRRSAQVKALPPW